MPASKPKKKKKLIIDDEAKSRIDAVLQSFVDDNIVAGASALIFEKGNEVYFNAFGHADREAGTPMSRNTIVTIYSMTKPVTGTALMTLYEKGDFTLEDSLATYLTEFKNMQVIIGYDESGQMILEPEDSLWLPGKGRVGFGIDFAVRTEPAKTPNENVGAVGEFFWEGAASTLFWVDPVNEMTVVLFVQIFPFQNNVHKRFRDAVYGPFVAEKAIEE